MHSIRLRGPWHYSLHGDESAPALARRRIVFPVDWSTVVPAGERLVRFSRRFNAPTGLAGDDRIHIALASVTSQPQLLLNGQPVALSAQPSEGVFCYDITTSIEPSNELHIDIRLQAGTACRGSVEVQIDAASTA